MEQSVCNGKLICSCCEIMKSRNSFVSVHTSVQYSRNNYILLPENIHTCMCGSIDKLIIIHM